MVMLTAILIFAAQETERVARDERCIECHEDAGPEVATSVHGAGRIGCISCHGEDDIVAKGITRGSPHRKSQGFRMYRRQTIPEDCGSCHQPEYESMKPSGHYTATKRGADEKGNMRGCIECHTHHATPQAVRGTIVSSCVRCHDTATKEYADGRSLFEGMDGLERALADDTPVRMQRRPGINDRAALDARVRGEKSLQDLKIRQHGLAFTELRQARDATSAALAAAYNRLAEEERAHARRWIWLLPFLALAATSMVLVRAKGRRL